MCLWLLFTCFQDFLLTNIRRVCTVQGFTSFYRPCFILCGHGICNDKSDTKLYQLEGA